MIDVAMIFAAGRGERMRPLTDTRPKPLLQVAGKALIEWQILALVRAGVGDIVINHAWLGAQIPEYLGDGSRFGVRLHYSAEGEALETAGGIVQALPLIEACTKSSVFLAVSGDVFTDYAYRGLHERAAQMARLPEPTMHLVMVDNPSFHAQGDFILHEQALFLRDSGVQGATLTFANIGLYDKRLFAGLARGQKWPMSPLYREAIAAGRATGEYFDGVWENVGTPSQLAALDIRVAGGAI